MSKATQTADQVSQDASVENSSPISSIAQSLIDGMPEVQQHAIDQHLNEQEELNSKLAVKDKSGAFFDPALHSVDKDGNPNFTAGGMFAKKRGRKVDSSQTGSSLGNVVKGASNPKVDQSAVILANKQAAAGTMMANALIMAGLVLGGDEWRPMKNEQMGIDEQSMLTQGFTDWMTAKNMEDLSPNVALCICVLGYALPRFTMPKTQQRTSSLVTKVKAWWINRKLKKHGLKAESVKEDK